MVRWSGVVPPLRAQRWMVGAGRDDLGIEKCASKGCRSRAAVLSGGRHAVPPAIESLFLRFAPAWVDRALIVKAVSFGLIGCVNAAVDFAVFSLLHLYFGLPIIPANLMSWCVAVTNSYVLNSMFTFAAESGRRLSFKAYIAFAATQVGGLIANTITVFVASFFIPVLVAKCSRSARASWSTSRCRICWCSGGAKGTAHAALTSEETCRWCIRRESDGRAADLRHPSRMLLHRRALSGRRGARPLARRQAAAGALRPRRRAQGADQGRAGASGRRTSGATASCCRCAAPPTSSASARR